MECFGTTDFYNNSQLITLSAIIISGLHCITYFPDTLMGHDITRYPSVVLVMEECKDTNFLARITFYNLKKIINCQQLQSQLHNHKNM